MKLSYSKGKSWTVAPSTPGSGGTIDATGNITFSEPFFEEKEKSPEEEILHAIRMVIRAYEKPDSDAGLAATYYKLFPNSMDRVNALKLTLKLAATQLFLPTEFLEYGLYKRTKAEQKAYISQLNMYSLWDKYNDRQFLHFRDKELANKLIRFRLGDSYATVDYPVEDNTLITKEEMKASVPFFAKPIDGDGGKGCIKVTKYNRLTDTFTTHIGRFTYEELQRKLNDKAYILQKVEKSCFVPYFAKKSLGLNTIRFVTVNGRLVGAVFKISSKYDLVDNFGVDGNYAVAIDLDTGELFNTMYRGKDFSAEYAIKIKGVHKIPEWDKTVIFIERAAKQFRPTRLIGFDVAITENGPVIIDFNATPGIRLLQIPYQMGFKKFIK